MLDDKLRTLREILRTTGGCAVAYSGGVDSSLLVTVAHEVLGDRCLAVIATSVTYPRQECESAVRFAESRGIPVQTIVSEELDIPGFQTNPPDRCYHCKKELFSKIRRLATERGLPAVADGTNADDVRDYRPGTRAAAELGVISPLRDAGLTKQEIRVLARKYRLPMADAPAAACLASRFPYGSPITRERLNQVENMESFLRELGFRVVRARHHDTTVRLELEPAVFARLFSGECRDRVVRRAKELGFTYVTVDLEGYRTGSMNETLDGSTTGRDVGRDCERGSPGKPGG